MLKNDALQQLSQLKASIRAQKDLAEGTVRGSQGRFGFVALDDGREVFLDPDTMQRVFPGDRVEVNVVTNTKGKPQAELEKLISSEFKFCTGRYRVRGKGHFVDIDYPQLNRWIFLPPKARNKAKEGDFVAARITRHPFDNEGKGQARIETVIGADSDAGIERDYIIAKHRLPGHWSTAALEQAQQLDTAGVSAGDGRRDLTHLHFVTIDADTTLDMDDALCIEEQGEGWLLHVAIADPTGLIAPGSVIDKIARLRANTVYLTGGALSMLPEQLSHATVSLVAGEQRPALVAKITLDHSAGVSGFEFIPALIRSRQKLSYLQVSTYLEQGGEAVDSDTGAMLQRLSRFGAKRHQYRAEQALVMDERPDYELVLNAQCKVESIEKRERTIAHRIVEEAMLVTNCCAGELLAQHELGLFSRHGGFRQERLKDVRLLLQENDRPVTDQQLSELDGYRALINSLQQSGDSHAQLLSTLKRMLQPSELSREAGPHFGLGFTHYATVTSPIRRYQDYFNHLAIKQIIGASSAPPLSDSELDALRQQLASGRTACRQLDQWLLCQYMQQRLRKHREAVYAGKIVLLNSQGIGVRLDDTGIDGFIGFNTGNKNAGNKNNSKKKDENKSKLSFDQRRMKLSADGSVYQLDQPLQVKVASVDLDRRQISFSLHT